MNIRPFQPGDEFDQLKIYNTAAAALPKFKPATLLDIRRRVGTDDFEPETRFYAVENDSVVGYCTWQRNGRVGFPWCLPGYEAAEEPLLTHTLQAMKRNGVAKAFSAYRKDWPAITGFFQAHGFVLAREMVNFVMPLESMPTASVRVTSAITPAVEADLPGILALNPAVLRVRTAEALKDAVWNNPWFKPESLFVLRNKSDGSPLAAGLFITNGTYADPRAVDSNMPCFRLGAFGTEGMTTKRIKGMFSFVARPDLNALAIGMDMVGHATEMLKDDDEIPCYAAQVASDVPGLLAFYEQNFERQGSFPVYDRDL